jgi:hypothetical protein
VSARAEESKRTKRVKEGKMRTPLYERIAVAVRIWCCQQGAPFAPALVSRAIESLERGFSYTFITNIGEVQIRSEHHWEASANKWIAVVRQGLDLGVRVDLTRDLNELLWTEVAYFEMGEVDLAS